MPSRFPWQFVFQSLVVLGAVGAAVLIYNSSQPAKANAQRPTFDMLAYLDDRIACQETEKDVRCWSSVNKIQMFLAGASISPEAISARIENYMELIDSVWRESVAQGTDDGLVPRTSLLPVLQQRFHHEIDPTTQQIKFNFNDQSEPVFVLADAIQDYGDTIEPWRLLQTWASRNTDGRGNLTISPVFSEDALVEFYEFLKTYDIALLKHACQIANDRKFNEIDSESMNLAFGNQ